ncbi:hypothetical protein L0N08_10550 [Enterocloster aldenensis]|uniref:DUF1292 domain-containing protein n=1 Tax=Enterocloster aldenensis TaxID=358742 RepID=A0AAW5BNP1_9FIRM|nr:hypothetical protein [Enterocloster aldenensis]
MKKRELIEKLEKLEDKEIFFMVVLHDNGSLLSFDKYPDEAFGEVYLSDIYESEDGYLIELSDLEDEKGTKD